MAHAAAVAGLPTVLVAAHIGYGAARAGHRVYHAGHRVYRVGHMVDRIDYAVERIDSDAPMGDYSQTASQREADTGSVGDQEAEGVPHQGGSSSSPAVEHLYQHRTWKQLAFRVPSK